MQLLAGTDAGTGVRGHVGMGGILRLSPTVWAGSGGQRSDTQSTYPLATYP